MASHDIQPPYDRFVTTGEQIIRDRPDADPEIVREIFLEVAGTLYNGLAFDGLDDHDTRAVVDGLCQDLVASDPGSAVRARAHAIPANPDGLHDPEAVSAGYLISAAMLQL